MPCTYYTNGEERDMARRELDRTTRLLCEAIELLRAAEVPLYAELKAWAEEHDEMDAARLKAEAEDAAARKRHREHKQKALAKLSKAEREALGIYGKAGEEV